MRPMAPGARSMRGQSLVEFGLILPVFLLLIFGLFDLGRAVYAWSTINNASREAARLLIVDQTFIISGSETIFIHARDEALRHSVALTVDPAQVEIDFRDPDVLDTPDSCEDVQTDPTTIRIGCVAAVEVEYTFQPATPVIGQLIGSLTLRGESRFSVEAVCQEPADPQCPPGD